MLSVVICEVGSGFRLQLETHLLQLARIEGSLFGDSFPFGFARYGTSFKTKEVARWALV